MFGIRSTAPPYFATKSEPARGSGELTLENVTLKRGIDKSTPKLAESIRGGGIFPKVEIHLTASYTDAGRVTYYAYELEDVRVTSYRISGSGEGDIIPVEDLTLNFEEVKVTYTAGTYGGKREEN